MDILEISKLPTGFRVEGIGIHVDGNGYSESLLRAWNILRKVKELLELGTPQSVILEMIAVMESIQYPDTTDFTVRVDSREYWPMEQLERIKAKMRDVSEKAQVFGSPVDKGGATSIIESEQSK